MSYLDMLMNILNRPVVQNLEHQALHQLVGQIYPQLPVWVTNNVKVDEINAEVDAIISKLQGGA